MKPSESIRISLFGGLLVLVALAQAAVAQTFYKSTLPDGKVIYGDKPVPGAVNVEVIKPDTSKTGIGPATPTTPAASREAAILKEMEKARLKREAADAKVQAAEKALRSAEAARAAGVESLEGERIGFIRQSKEAGTGADTDIGTGTGTDTGTAGTGTGKGTGTKFGTRLTDAYFERQKKLEEAVAAARDNLERVRSGK